MSKLDAPGSDGGSVVDRAQRIADDVLFPGASSVDRGDTPVRDRLDVFADAGLYGLHVPREHDGLGVPATAAHRVVEALASGCLTSTFVWIQHQGVVKRLVADEGPLARAFLPRMATGAVRAGVAVGGVRGDAPTLRATRVDEGWRLDGSVPWISGFGMIDVVLIAAVPAGDPAAVLWLLADAPRPLDDDLRVEDPVIALDRYRLVGLDHSASARAAFSGLVVPDSRVLGRQPREEWRRRDREGLRTNGSLSLGVAGRCAALASSPDVEKAVERVRDRLDTADADALPEARAAASALVWEACGRLLAEVGGGGVVVGQHAERLAREAMVLQVFGTRPAITAAMLARGDARLARLPGEEDA